MVCWSLFNKALCLGIIPPVFGASRTRPVISDCSFVVIQVFLKTVRFMAQKVAAIAVVSCIQQYLLTRLWRLFSDTGFRSHILQSRTRKGIDFFVTSVPKTTQRGPTYLQFSGWPAHHYWLFPIPRCLKEPSHRWCRRENPERLQACDVWCKCSYQGYRDLRG